jgi:hypothetical protein
MATDNDTPADVVDDAASEVPEETVTETETHHETDTGGSGDNEILHAIESLPSKIVEALNAAKEESPVTPAEEEVLDETPLRRPWTHRGFGRK